MLFCQKDQHSTESDFSLPKPPKSNEYYSTKEYKGFHPTLLSQGHMANTMYLCIDHGGLRGPCCASQWTFMVGSPIPVAWEFLLYPMSGKLPE